MLKRNLALLYTAIALVANPLAADTADIAELRSGDMRKLIVHGEPMPGSDVVFLSEDGTEMTLAAYEGKYIVLNFWATWCAPCRIEMPDLSALQEELQGEHFEVVTIATGRNTRADMERFLNDIDARNLPLHTDARQNLARSLGVLGLPVTLILDPQGQEIARMQGHADWSSDSAKSIVNALTAELEGDDGS